MQSSKHRPRWLWLPQLGGTWLGLDGLAVVVERSVEPVRARLWLWRDGVRLRCISCPAEALILNQYGTVESVDMKWIRQQAEEQVRSETQVKGLAASWAGKFEAIWEYLTCDTDASGNERERALLMFFVDGVTFKACLQDRACGRSLWASGEALEKALEALEACLRSPSPDWRHMRSGGGKPSKKR